MKLKTNIFLLFLLTAMAASAQKPLVWNLWDGLQPPTSNGLTGPEKDMGDHVSNVTEPTLTVYVPQNPTGLAVLSCPGGGYVDVWIGTEGNPMAWWYLNQGITYAVLKYRLPNGHCTVPLEDVHRAMDMLWEHADEFGFKHLGIQGCSAGGHLAASASVLYDSPKHRPDFQILFYPLISCNPEYAPMDCCERLVGKGASKELLDRYSCEKQVTADTPPAMILMSSDDPLLSLRHPLDYYTALTQNKVPASLHMYPIGGHGWCYQEWFRYKDQWTGELSQWLRWLQSSVLK